MNRSTDQPTYPVRLPGGVTLTTSEAVQASLDLDGLTTFTLHCQEILDRRLDALDAAGIAVSDRTDYGAVRRLYLGIPQ